MVCRKPQRRRKCLFTTLLEDLICGRRGGGGGGGAGGGGSLTENHDPEFGEKRSREERPAAVEPTSKKRRPVPGGKLRIRTCNACQPLQLISTQREEEESKETYQIHLR